jgi:large subunit ribosomal protein L24
MFNNTEEDVTAKRKSEAPMSIDDVRLVVPYEITQKKTVVEDGEELEVPVKLYTDVIVEKVFMERVTTGIDPFTGTDYGDAEIPKEHQYDPQTGLPIFKRYIAGTRQEIEWPWEREDEIEDSGITQEEKADKQSLFVKAANTLAHPIQTFKRWRTKDTKAVTQVKEREEALDEGLSRIEQEVMEMRKNEKPRSQDPRFHDAFDNTDTTRNIVEAGENMRYSILNPPMPLSLGDELRGHIQSFGKEQREKDVKAGVPATKKVKRTTERSQMMSEISKAKHAAAQQMKTPMQLRWETEHAKKVKQQKTKPLVSTDELMAALGAHISQKKMAKKVGELD